MTQEELEKRNALVLQWMGLPFRVWRKMSSCRIVQKLGKDDAVAAGMVGLVKAAQGYDTSRRAQFQTYAWYAIRREIMAAAKLSRLIYIPYRDKSNKGLYAGFARNAGRGISSIFGERLRDMPGRPNFVQVEFDDEVLFVKRLCKRLPEHYQDILRMRFDDGLSFEAIAERTGKWDTVVKRQYKKAIRMIQEALGA